MFASTQESERRHGDRVQSRGSEFSDAGLGPMGRQEHPRVEAQEEEVYGEATDGAAAQGQHNGRRHYQRGQGQEA